MDYQKFTEKSMSAIYSAEQSAREYGNPEIKQAHLLYALLKGRRNRRRTYDVRCVSLVGKTA